MIDRRNQKMIENSVSYPCYYLLDFFLTIEEQKKQQKADIQLNKHTEFFCLFIIRAINPHLPLLESLTAHFVHNRRINDTQAISKERLAFI